ncbi:MAG: anti-sigma factor [Acidimicrobiales bacterium]
MTETTDYEGYDDLMQLGRQLTPEDRRQFTLPADLWTKIAHEVDADEHTATVHAIDEHRSRRRRMLTRVALVGAAACALIAFAVVRAGDHVRTIDEVALSNAGLDPAGASSTGRARLVVLDDGSRAIDLDVSNLPKINGEFFELWLIDRQVKGMVSIGPVHGNGRYIIPAGVATNAFPIVDLSIEPVDGVPTHSGVSVLRGVLA